MMIQNQIKDDVHELRLLSIEFQKMEIEYCKSRIPIKTRSVDPYEPPVSISNLKELLTSSIVSQGQGLLDFWLQRVVEFHCNRLQIEIIKRKRNENCLDWIKVVLKQLLKKHFINQYNFGASEFQKLKTFYEIRNYHVHSGGYLTEDSQRKRLNGEPGISIDNFNLFTTDYSYCNDILNCIETFLIKLVVIV